jgi:drug/metabolite transporter (DMT)-like permease
MSHEPSAEIPTHVADQRALTVKAPWLSGWAAAAPALFTMVVWASAFPAIRAALALYSPGQLAALRFSIASIAFLGLLLLGRKRLPRPQPRHVLRIVLAGVLGVASYNLLLNTGELSVAAGPASFIVNIGPLFTALLATRFLGERVPWQAGAGALISLSGVALIALSRGPAGASPAGVLMILAAALCQSIQFILQKPLTAHYGALPLTAYVIWSGSLFLLPFLPGGAAALLGAPATAWTASASLLYLALVPGLLGFLSWTVALKRLGASRASAFLYLAPAASTLIGALWLGEIPSAAALCGGSLAVAGLIVFNALCRRQDARRAALPTESRPPR